MSTTIPPSASRTINNRTLPVVHPTTSATAARAATVADRSAAGATPAHSTVFQPWTALLARAEARYKTEIATAISALDRAMAEAGQLLDVSAAQAAEAAGHLETVAWSAWHKYMAMADATRNGALQRATTAYDQAITYARAAYDASLADAEHTYQAIAADASRAQADVKAISA